ncbi:3-methylfumaryl-CoA hydratase [Tamaricihabitans halophyticus]|uniref:3-methylfumaryl-CoA hydratase n=1 Tax=Tamaricihabitans halophyticus TaxID=1262583 RepID=A0A4R2QUJ3_9PSEU|nr:MaoC family dehydratase N-terminal domain-containing protein [Tamaricihabitans halophyticus]TCP50745.1 3-methylfumaryl-CoA hydratase [Tamaricihabitans halophyticus]
MRNWQPRTVSDTELLDPYPVATFAALLDDGRATPRPGDELPPLWHWLALARWPSSSALGSDGHSARGSFLPPVDLPRRMFAGGDVTLHRPLRVGDTVRRESTVESVTEKSGRSGALVVVVVRTRLFDADGSLCVDERQDLIYRESGTTPRTVGAAGTPQPVATPLRRVQEWTWNFATDPTLLMRFSAATANPHRIHYDWPYATGVEGYPGLVVHGPLITLALAELPRLENHPGRVIRVRHRSKAPLFCGEPAQLHGERTADGLVLELFGSGGSSSGAHASMTMDIE